MLRQLTRVASNGSLSMLLKKPSPTAALAAAPARSRLARTQHNPRFVAPQAFMTSAAQPAKAQPEEDEKMFCYQCEQTTKGVGCTKVGVCGKSPETAGLQDLLVYAVKGLSAWAAHVRAATGTRDPEVDSFILNSIFSTLTNVNFSDVRFKEYLVRCSELKGRLASQVPDKPPTPEGALPWVSYADVPHPVDWDLDMFDGEDTSLAELIDFSEKVGIRQRLMHTDNDTLIGLQELLTYGLKGLAAYAAHAEALGFTDPAVMDFTQDVMAFLASPEAGDADAVLAKCLECGRVNGRVLQLLDEAHTTRFGHPEPSPVSLRPEVGKCIVVSGHDLHDLHDILQATEGKGINIYTHGELLPAHGYPGLKKFAHLKGHYGGAWYRQKLDFDRFPGPIVMTTNCVLEPLETYRDNLFTINEVGVKGSKHLGTKDYSVVIQRALELKGFDQRHVDKAAGKKDVMVGFGHNAVLGVADQVIDAVKGGKLKHIFLVGGCDGSEPQRKYYKNLAQMMPEDTLALTLGCGKFRIFDQEWGTVPGTGLPRLLDMGQCNDAYSALVVAQALADAFETDINSLPLSLDLSWFEQKAVAILLTLLDGGVKNIRLGPALPAFLTPEAIALLVRTFDLKPAALGDPEGDLKKMLRGS